MKNIFIVILILLQIMGVSAEELYPGKNVDSCEVQPNIYATEFLKLEIAELSSNPTKGNKKLVIIWGDDTISRDTCGCVVGRNIIKTKNYKQSELQYNSSKDTLMIYSGVDSLQCDVCNAGDSTKVSYSYAVFNANGESILIKAPTLTTIKSLDRANTNISELRTDKYNIVILTICPFIIGLLLSYVYIRYRKVRMANMNTMAESQSQDCSCSEDMGEKTLESESNNTSGHRSQLSKIVGMFGSGKTVKYEYDKGAVTADNKMDTHEVNGLEDEENETATSEEQKENLLLKDRICELELSVDNENKKLVEAEAEVARLTKEIEDVKEGSKNAISKIENSSAEEIKKLKKEHLKSENAARERENQLLVDCANFQSRNEELFNDLSTAKQKLSETEKALHDAGNTIEYLNKAQEKFNIVLRYVPFARDYARSVNELLSIKEQIQKSALALLDLKIDDPYYIMKYITRFDRTVIDINMDNMVTELKMIENGDMVLCGSTLSTYDQSQPQESLESSTRQYFFVSYLQKLIDGIVVLNESLVGSHRVVDGLSSRDVEVFAGMRERINTICNKLGVVVESVKLFDDVGQKTDLRVIEQVDAGFTSGDIVDIENAIVYLAGTHRPDVKIRVKIQE